MTVKNSPAELSSALANQRNDVPLIRYSGRFAPSPTGPLHFGSLITAVASYCDARAHQGRWLVRVEDTDIPRIYPGSEDHILASLEAFQFDPDAEIIFQKDRLDIYESVLDQLKKRVWFTPVNVPVKCSVQTLSMQAHVEICISTSNIKPFG
ncbi:hypothetical protein OCUAc20_41630 [Acinetobacter baumannii]|nr:hypothetical protein OCUAc20_41630 [Acinetobacter baumannii]